MVITWLGRVTAVLGFVAWLLQVFAHAAAGDRKSPLEEPFFWAGIAFMAVACALMGFALTRTRPFNVQLAGAAVGIVAGAGVVLLCYVLVKAVLPASWGWYEGSLGLLLGSAMVAVGGLVAHDSRRRVVRRNKATAHRDHEAQRQAEADREEERLRAESERAAQADDRAGVVDPAVEPGDEPGAPGRTPER